MQLDLKSNPSSGLCINLDYVILFIYITWSLYFASWGVITVIGMNVYIQCTGSVGRKGQYQAPPPLFELGSKTDGRNKECSGIHPSITSLSFDCERKVS